MFNDEYSEFEINEVMNQYYFDDLVNLRDNIAEKGVELTLQEVMGELKELHPETIFMFETDDQ